MFKLKSLYKILVIYGLIIYNKTESVKTKVVSVKRNCIIFIEKKKKGKLFQMFLYFCIYLLGFRDPIKVYEKVNWNMSNFLWRAIFMTNPTHINGKQISSSAQSSTVN